MKESDSFIKLFDKFNSNTDNNEIKKNQIIDEQFLKQISQFKKNGAKQYSQMMSDKLRMLQKVEEISRDPGLHREYNEYVMRRQKLLRAMESMVKSTTKRS